MKESLLKQSVDFAENKKHPLRGFLRRRCSENMQQIYRKHPCRSAIFIKFLRNFNEIALRHGCSPENLLHIFRISFPKNTSGGLLLKNYVKSFQWKESHHQACEEIYSLLFNQKTKQIIWCDDTSIRQCWGWRT